MVPREILVVGVVSLIQEAAKTRRLVLLGYGVVALMIAIIGWSMSPVSQFQFFAFRVLTCLAAAGLCAPAVKISLLGIHAALLKTAVAASVIAVPAVATWYAYPVVFPRI